MKVAGRSIAFGAPRANKAGSDEEQAEDAGSKYESSPLKPTGYSRKYSRRSTQTSLTRERGKGCETRRA
jgi:hypothetical protein